MNTPKLTILIPTYNRRDQLIELLKSIEKQGHYDEYNIFISDNHSNYDVSESLNNNLSREFLNIIKVHSWRFNTGMSTNISVPFLFVETEWCWVIGDDDTITDTALSKVLNDIEDFKDVLAIKYSLENVKPAHRDILIDNQKDFADYYNEDGRGGEMMYLSMVYNLKNLYPYLTSLTEYSYTYLSFLIPILLGLAKGGKIRFSSFGAVAYRRVTNDNWASERYLKVALGIRTMLDADLDADDMIINSLQKVLVKNITIGTCCQSLFCIKSRKRRYVLWQSLKPMLKLSGAPLKFYTGSVMFYVYHWFGLNLFRYLYY